MIDGILCSDRGIRKEIWLKICSLFASLKADIEGFVRQFLVYETITREISLLPGESETFR